MKIIGEEIKNLPWEDCPAECNDVFWRSKKNPILTKKDVPYANSIFNSAVVPFDDGFVGVFRVDDTTRWPNMHIGRSNDGVNWDIDEKPIKWTKTRESIADFVYGYDPRVCKIGDRYYITWCNDYNGPTIGIAYTYDFKTIYQTENAFLPRNRNGVLFPRKIGNMYYMLNRPIYGENIGEMFISQSLDLEFWGRHRLLMKPVNNWESNKLGAGPIPIETDEGWVVVYHGVLKSCNGLMYTIGCAILDLDDPTKVKYRTKRYIMGPDEIYERVGDVPNVVFPCSMLADSKTGRITMYYGCADTVIGMAYTTIERLVEFTKKNTI